MANVSSQFVGSIPEAYDQGLGPVLFDDYAEDLARRAGAACPARVLELAAGTGILSRKLRDALPATAQLVVTDLNPPMLEVARGKFRAGEAVEFAQADAMALPFGAEEFDLVVCQFGVMFFPDKVASFREVARVLRPGGHYLFNTWGPIAANPYAQIADETLAQYFPDDPPGFYKVPFSYADPVAVAADLKAAGWTDVAHVALPLEKTIADFPAFTQSTVYGNPAIVEIRQRGRVDPDAVVATVRAAFHRRWGVEPITMPLLATVFTCRAP